MVDGSHAIRYVCISDLHLGEESSLLTDLKNGKADCRNPSPVMVELDKCLRYLLSVNDGQGDIKPTLIANGDILEMALCDIHQSATVFDRFLDLIMPEGNEIFDKIVYIPGNHDQHIWEMARATQYVDYLRKYFDKDLEPPNFMFDMPWHKTRIFLEEPSGYRNYIPSSDFLDAIVGRYKKDETTQVEKTRREKKHGSSFKIWVAYPNFGLLSSDSKKCILFHHGHFSEPVYRLMSSLNNFLVDVDDYMPTNIDNLQKENFAWIEFFWSMLGRSGRVGETVESLWEQLADDKSTRVLARKLARSMFKKLDLPLKDIPLIINMFADNLIEKMDEEDLFRFFRQERTLGDIPITPELKQETISFLKYPLWNHMRMELKEMKRPSDFMPERTSLIIGHTHKPMQENIDISFPVKSASIYNTGGWVIDKPNPNPAYGGAIALIDDHMNVALLGMFREACEENEGNLSTNAFSSGKRIRQSVMLLEDGLPGNDLINKLKPLISSSESPWKEFSSVAANEMSIREENICCRLDKRNAE